LTEEERERRQRKEGNSLPVRYLLYIQGVTPPSFHKPAFQCAYEAMGSDRLLLGTDHPFGKGNMPNTVRFIEELDILSQEDKEKILAKNAIRLLGL